MDEPYFRISYGSDSVDLLPLSQDIKWSLNDLDGPESGRTLDTKMWRDKLGEKARFDIKLIPVRTNKMLKIMRILRHQFFECNTNIIPIDEPLSVELYNSVRSGNVFIDTDKKIVHTNVAFNIIQR